jgi:hypothetical protein
MSKKRISDLEQQIEALIGNHVAELRRMAEAAVARAFCRASASGPGTGTPRRSGPRRTPTEMSALGERLYAAICAHPGAAMNTLAAELGATPRQLHRPVTTLRRAGRVRSVGQRQQTRYFPMTAKLAGRRSQAAAGESANSDG